MLCVFLVQTGTKKANQCQAFSIPDLGFAGAPLFWSLAHRSMTDLWSELGVDFEHESSDSEGSDDGEEGTRSHPDRPGRPRLEDPRGLGDAIVLFVRDFISAHGQVTTDADRLACTGFVFGAPLRRIAEAACLHFKQPISSTAIGNLLAQPRHDSTGPQRSVVLARPCRIAANHRELHARCCFSASLFKTDILHRQGKGFGHP